jgi:hypothetical protein
MAVRLWTHGWDFYSPRRTVVYHQWARGERPSFREVLHPGRTALQEQSREKALRLLKQTSEGAGGGASEDGAGGGTPEARCDTAHAPTASIGAGLGSVRTLDAFTEFCGVDFDGRKLSARARGGGTPNGSFKETSAAGAQVAALMGGLGGLLSGF